jgi:ATP-dependent DNA helicase RecG
MLSKEQLQNLIVDIESDHVERTTSTNDTDKFAEAICAFSNDMAGRKQPGYLLLGVHDKTGNLSGLKATDKMMKDIAAIRSDGNILPQPAMTVHKYTFEEGDVIVVEVTPAHFPPVRYKGRIWIRVGSRRAIANEMEERMLIEKRAANITNFDEFPFTRASIDDLDIDLFKKKYLPNAVDTKILADDNRDIKMQLASLRFYDFRSDCPTIAGVLAFGKDVRYFFPVAYVQFVKFEGKEIYSNVIADMQFHGNLITLADELDRFIKLNIIKKRPIPVSTLFEDYVYNYSDWAIREFLMNTLIHRSYEINSPVKFYQYSDRIEIINPGGLYGNARPENFPNVNDYRNPTLAEVLRVMKVVNRFARGVTTAQQKLVANGNGQAKFDFDTLGVFGVTIREKIIEAIPADYSNPDRKVKYGNELNLEQLLDIEQEILQVINNEEGINRIKISEILNKPQRTIMRHLTSLREKGLIEYVGSLKQGGYRITFKLS